MTKSDLKTGMVVKLRNGNVYRVFRNVAYYIVEKADVLIPLDLNNIIMDFTEYYNDSLRHKDDNNYDIIEIRRIICVAQLIEDVNFNSLTLLWKREEKKKYTFAQLRDIVGEDFEIVKE